MTITTYLAAGLPGNEPSRQRATERSGVLNRIGDPSLMALAEKARRYARADNGMVCAVSHYNVFVIGQHGVRSGVFSRATSFVGHLIMDDADDLVVPDAAKDDRFSGYPLVESGEVAFYAAAGLRAADRCLIGALCLTSRLPRLDWSAADQRILSSFAAEAARLIRAAHP